MRKWVLVWLTINTITAQLISSVPAPITLPKVTIEADFAGVFVKSTVVFEFDNNSDINNRQAICSFYTNTNSFVTDMWLEINGRYKKSVTFSQHHAARIYEEITGLKRDPALLEYEGNGHYNLRVFPFGPRQKHKVKLIILSTLDYKKGTWYYFFQNSKRETKVHLSIRNIAPEIQPQFGLELKEKDQGLFQNFGNFVNMPVYFALFGSQAVYGEKSAFRFLNQEPYENQNCKTYADSLNAGLVLNQIVTTSDKSTCHNLSKVSWTKMGFIDGFLRFLQIQKGINIKTGNEATKSEWHKVNNNWQFISNGKTMIKEMVYRNSNTSRSLNMIDDFHYQLQSLALDTKSKIKRKILSRNTSFIVLEDNKTVDDIVHRVTRTQNTIFDFDSDVEPGSENTFNRRDTEVIPFWQVVKKPTILYREEPKYPALMQQLGIDNMVVIGVVVDSTGKVFFEKVLKGSPLFVRAAKDAIQKWRFKAGASETGKINVRMTIPVRFQLNEYKPGIAFSKEVQVYDKVFSSLQLGIRKTYLVEQGFDYEHALYIGINSQRFFELLYAEPGQIRYALLHDRLGLIFNGRSYLVQ
jgi:TonB family protein